MGVASWELSAEDGLAYRVERPPRMRYRAVAASSYALSEGNGSATGDARTLVGTFAVYNRLTEINSASEGHFVERIAPGAFRKTIQESRDRIKVMFSHGRDPSFGGQLLGSVRDLHEDEQGVHYTVDLFDGIPPLLLAGLRSGAYGASFRGRVIKERFSPHPARSPSNPLGLPESTVVELALKEFGPTASPAYDQTSAGLRSISDEYVPHRRIVSPRGAGTDRVASGKPDWWLGERN